MKKYYTLLLFIIVNCIYTQSKNVNNTDYKFEFYEQRNDYESTFTLQIDDDISLWEETGVLKPLASADLGNAYYMEPDYYLKKKVYKDFSDSIMLSNYDISGHVYNVKEEIPDINWDIKDSVTTFLDFKCSVATTTFKGKEYVATFTTEIPISNGPWKLSGLPGFILKVESDFADEYYKMECTKISTQKQNLKNAYKDFKKKRDKFFSWDEFTADVEVFLTRKMKLSASQDEGGKGYSKYRLINRLEIINLKAQTTGFINEYE